MWEIVPAETHSAVFPFQNLDHRPYSLQLSAFSEMGSLNIHPADSQATQAGAFPQMVFVGWDFHYVFPSTKERAIKIFYNSNTSSSPEKTLMTAHPPLLLSLTITTSSMSDPKSKCEKM